MATQFPVELGEEKSAHETAEAAPDADDERDRKEGTEVNAEKFANVFSRIKKDNAKAFQAAAVAFKQFMAKGCKLSIDRFPLHHFAIQQACLHVLDLNLKMKRERLTVIDIREDLENLAYLSDLLRDDYKDISVIVLNLLSNIIDIIGPLWEIFEKASGLSVTNYKAISEAYKSQQKVQGRNIKEMVPKMKIFNMGRLLGAGGFGAVYKASFGKITCTLKFVPVSKLPSPKFACVDKVVATMINSPFLVKYYACFATVQAYVTCMEFIRGVDLQKVLRAAKKFSDEINRLVIGQLGAAVHHMHTKGFTHRDIKPANMLIIPGCRVKLIDFDTVKLFCGKFAGKLLATFFRRTAAEIMDGQRAGTPPYYAPESVAKKAYGRSIDWWAVGVTAFMQGTGKLPFYHKDRDEMFNKIKSGKYTWPTDDKYGSDFKSYCDKSLVRNPHLRLVSKSYDEFYEHPFISPLNWKKMKTAKTLNDYQPILDCMKGGGGKVSPVASPAALQRRKNLFPKEDFDDSNNQKPLFTYASPGFLRSLEMINNGDTPTEETIYDKPVVIDEDSATVYKFEEYLIAGKGKKRTSRGRS